jgi:iron(III) transport system ATP-binding protein
VTTNITAAGNIIVTSNMLTVTGLSKTYQADHGAVHAVKHVSFQVPEGSFYTLLGPSGCGKTTTLRCVAGLERSDDGVIELDGRVVSSPSGFVPPHQRDVGMVFQSYAIWPHMSVFENVAFPLRVAKRRVPDREVKERVREALRIVQLDGLEDRPAPQLSGGQQQRLALARALVRRPKLLLLDEPLSNLDAKLRAGLRLELRQLQQQLGITTIYVTHDQIEALAMSTVVAVMRDGIIAQEGPPREVYEKPNSRYVAEFVGTTNFIPGRVAGRENGGATVHVQTEAGGIHCLATAEVAIDADVLVSIRPEFVELASDSARAGGNVVNGRVETVVFLGEYLDCIVRVAGQPMHVRLHPLTPLEPGQSVSLVLPVEQSVAVPYEPERAPEPAAGMGASGG